MLTAIQEKHFQKAFEKLTNFLVEIPLGQEAPQNIYETQHAIARILTWHEAQMHPLIHLEFIGDTTLSENTIDLLQLLGYLSEDDVVQIKIKYCGYYQDDDGSLRANRDIYDCIPIRIDERLPTGVAILYQETKREPDQAEIALQKSLGELNAQVQR